MRSRTGSVRREILKPAAAGFAIGLLLSPLHAQGERLVRQVKTGFMPNVVEVERGGSLAITNDDPFLHHVFVESPGFRFDSGEQKPGESIAIQFTVPGRFVAQCAIHLKMRLTVVVR
jgi:plastocyanin